MKQGSNRRPRPRGNPNNGNKPRSGGRHSYDSNGPGGKVRGTAQQVLDKYQALGRDAMTAGDRIAAESFFQFAEHYYRIVNVDGVNSAAGQSNQTQTQTQERRDRQEPEQPVAVAEAPMADASAQASVSEPVEASTRSESSEPVTEPVLDLGEPAPVPKDEVVKEDAPKAPRRRRSRAKAEPADA